ncbi:MAG: GNAT family N-acetyltransferase [Firmicutes bacterium]|nr:GNAT family N-acetyltransferase [Bacillota bacterium]
MNLRKILQSDKEKYIEMATEFYNSEAVDHAVDTPNFEKAFDEMMRSDTYVECWFIEENAKIAGYIMLLKTYSQEAGGICIWFDEVWVEPEFRGRGIGGNALKQMMSIYSDAARFRLEYSEENPRAAQLYRRLGFDDLVYRQMCIDKH